MTTQRSIDLLLPQIPEVHQKLLYVFYGASDTGKTQSCKKGISSIASELLLYGSIGLSCVEVRLDSKVYDLFKGQNDYIDAYWTRNKATVSTKEELLEKL